MMHSLLLTILAVTYGTNPYDTSTYGGSGTGAGAGAAAGAGASGGGLTNTGIAIATFVTIASLILLTAFLIRFYRRPAKKADTTPQA